MKTIRIFAYTLICGLFVGSATSALAQDKQGVATVIRISGEAQYQLGDGQWHPLVVGKVLGAGATIRSGTDATVDLVLGENSASMMPQAESSPSRISLASDSNVRGFISYKPSVEQNAVRMTGGTVMKIDKLTVSSTGMGAVSDTELDLKQGRIFNSVKKLSGGSQYLVKIPTGVAGVRGTLFGIGADGWLAVYKNSVLISLVGSDGKPTTIVVDQGNYFNPQTGQTAPLTPEMQNMLGQIMTAIRTLYTTSVNFTYDRTTVYVSPTAGN